MWIELPDEIIVEILTWLPAKTLLRFRCVCKPWRALISDSSFVQKHLNRANRFKLLLGSTDQVTVLSSNEDGVAIKEQPHDYPCSNEYIYPRIYGSSNGLVCLETVESWHMMLWNPCTREFKQILPEREPTIEGKRDEVFLAGFGYDSTIEDYKIIYGTQAYDCDEDSCFQLDDVKLQVFTLKTGSWRTIPDFNCLRSSNLAGRGPNFPTQGTLVNETLYWLAKDSTGYYFRIWSFGLAEEKFQIMVEFRRTPSPSRSKPSIMNDGKSLFLHRDLSIWMIKEGEASWTKKLDISLDNLPQHYLPHRFDSLWPVGILENGDVLLKNNNAVRKALALYNPEKKTFKNVDWKIWTHAVYVETLVSPMTCIDPVMEKDGK